MTLQRCLNIFAYLLDKYGSPNLEDQEVIDLLSMALQGEYMNRVFPDNQGSVVNYEFDSNTTSNLQPLIWTVSTTMNASGIVTNSALNSALATASGQAGATYFRIGSIGLTADGKTYPVKYIKQNNIWSFTQNVFKKPVTKRPGYTLVGNGLQFYPTDTTKTLTINVVKKPKLFALADLASEVELSDYVMFSVISIAVKLAGVALRDEEILNDARLAGLQISQ
jgi:hypothetical protein